MRRGDRLNRFFLKLWSIISSIIVAAVVLFAVALVGVRLLGLQPFAVLSGSMEPTYQTGSLIYVRETDYTELKVGDPVTFLLSEDVVATHRIVEIVPDATDPATLRFRTKGDNNDTVDGSIVHYKNIIGKPVFTIPYLGYVANYIQNPPGMYIAISTGLVLLILVFLPDMLRAAEAADKRKAAADAEAQRERAVAKAYRRRKRPRTTLEAPPEE